MTRTAMMAIGVALATLGALHAQVPVRDAVQSLAPPSGTGRISGTVVDAAGEPVRRATVLITGDMRLDRRTVTDNEGRFGFASLPSGRFTVSTEKPGYPRMSHGAKRPFRNGAGIFLEEGGPVSDITLTLAPGAVLTGTVRDEHGQPQPGVPVMAWLIRESLSGERTLDFAASGPDTVVTDDRGRYRTYGLPPGEYTIGTTWYYHGQGFDVRVPTEAEFRAAFPAPGQPPDAARPGPPGTADPPRYNYAPVFAPGVSDPLAAATYALAAGEVREGVDLQMRFEPTSRIEGTVVNPGGTPITTRLSIARRSPVQALNSTQVSGTGPDGRFTSTSLSPGQYHVLVQTRQSSEGPALWAMADVHLSGGEPTAVTLTLAPALTVTGRLVFDGTTLPPPVALSRVGVNLWSVGPTRADTSTTTDAEGHVSITGVIPGRYVIRGSVPPAAMAGAAGPDGATWTMRSVTIADRDVTDRALDITAAGTEEFVVTFTDRVSELGGTLTRPDGSPETDYFVIAMPADRELWLPSSRRIVSTRPDGAGRYLFRSLPAGEYLIAVTTDLVPQDLQQVGTLSTLAEQSLPVTVVFGERRTLDVRTTGG
jgi:protocatechuate 3,4-dioxygenase beta subunit